MPGYAPAGWEKSWKRGRPNSAASASTAWSKMGSVVAALGSHTTAARASRPAITGNAAAEGLSRSSPSSVAAL